MYYLMRYFVSGHRDITEEEFLRHYEAALLGALDDKEASFVVGDSHGVDAMAQKFLKQHTDKVTVYHIGASARNSNGFSCKGGYPSHNQKDKAMTLASDLDIAWVRSEEEQKKLYGAKYRHRKSGTQCNLERRAKINKKK